MKDLELLFRKNFEKNATVKIYKGNLIYRSKSLILDGNEIKRILNYLNLIESKYSKIHIPIILNLNSIVEISDKLTYIILECICYYLIAVKKIQLILLFRNNINCSIFTEGFISSPLLLITGKRSSKNVKKYSDKFKSDIFGNHYRKVINNNINLQINSLGSIMNDIMFFLIHLGVSQSCSEEISKTAIELIGNAIEHTKGDCLVDIDVSNGYTKKGFDNEEFYGVNLVVLNFSKNLLGESLYVKIKDDSLELNERYKYVKDAYNNHRKHFNSFYNEEDFYNVASFQHKISGDSNKVFSGGKGLTQLIESLESRSDAHQCYVLSGNEILRFYHEFLKFDKDNWIGFNKENNFLNCVPDIENIARSNVYLPGTAFNLNFAMKKEGE